MLQMTETYVCQLMFEAYHDIMDEAEEWGPACAENFYHFSAGATAMIRQMKKLMEADHVQV